MPTDRDVPTRHRAAGTRPLRFHPLTFAGNDSNSEGDVVVGRADLDSYVVLPADGAVLLRRLYEGAAVGDAADWYEQQFGEQVDVEDFVDSLADLGLLRNDPTDGPEGPAGRPGGGAPQEGPPEGSAPVRFRRLGAAVFSAPAWCLYGAVVLAAIAAIADDPFLAPRHDHVFFSDSLLAVELTLFALQFPLVLVHELGHVLAGRRLGLRTSVRVSRRLYFLVFETRMNSLVTVPPAQRYLPMLAGLLVDLLVAAVLTVVAWLLRGPGGEVGGAAALCLALVLTTLLRMAWQLYFFLRTDVYYLLSTVLSCVDLHRVSTEVLRNAVNRRLRRTDRLVPEENWHPRDRRAARWYAPLIVLGYTLAVVLAVVVLLPIAWAFVSAAVGRVFLGQSSSPAQFWDAAGLLALNGGQLLAAGVLALRERRPSFRRPSLRPSLSATPTPPAQEPS